MSEEERWGWPPIGSPLNIQRPDQWKHFDNNNNSVNAVSFGFVATAILISMFLIMALFERFLSPQSSTLSPSGDRRAGDLEARTDVNLKLDYPSPKVPVYAREVSVMMPGEHTPTFIAHPAPVLCPAI